MKTVIAPTNFSEASLHAVNYAADMAQAFGADLVLLHIIQFPVSFDVPLTEYEYDGMLQSTEQELAKLKTGLLLRTENEISISTKAILGTMQNEIEDTCETNRPFIVVIGTERKNWAERYFLGSNSFTVIKNLHYPVLVVPQNAIFRHIRRIGLASDFQNVEELPVEILRELVEIFDASVDIIHVSKSKEEEAKNAVPFSLLKDRLKEFDPETHFIINNNIEKAIHDYAEQHHEDLIMVISRKHTFLESLVHKSQSRQIALNTHIPVLAVAE